MFFTGKSLHRRLAIIGAAAVASAVGATIISAPARAAVDVRVEAVFDWIDADRNGSISLAEFLIKPGDDDPLRAIAIEVETKSRFQGETREQLFRLLDRNADGRMILAELAAGCVVRTIVTPAIEAADSNRDGGITESELAAYLAVSTAAAGKADPARAATIFARGILGEHDSDGDGKIVLQDMRS